MDFIKRSILISGFILCSAQSLLGQVMESGGYAVNTSPNFWYNSVDGIRVGILFEGRVPGTDEEGPHRLNAGIWLGTWLPVHPLSYRVTYTEPIPAISEYGNEGAVQITSSIREGYHLHRLGFQKRWQRPFDARHYWEAGVAYSTEQRFDDSYLQFPELWSSDWKGLVRFTVRHQHRNRAGLFQLSFQTRTNTIGPAFTASRLILVQELEISDQITLRSRGFLGITGRDAYPEYRFMRSAGPAASWLEHPLIRSKGTVPEQWFSSGYLHFSGGANLRGYTAQDMEALNTGSPGLYSSIGALNLELDLPNPIENRIRRSDILSAFVSFRSYLFSDFGFAPGLTDDEPSAHIADAGAGIALSLNIPDYLDKPRRVVLRYEIPFWLSNAGEEKKFKLRHLAGVGVIISF